MTMMMILQNCDTEVQWSRIGQERTGEARQILNTYSNIDINPSVDPDKTKN